MHFADLLTHEWEDSSNEEACFTMTLADRMGLVQFTRPSRSRFLFSMNLI